MSKPYLMVAKWNDYQHYKDRRPIWIKFYVDILHDPKLLELPIPTRLLWDQLLLLAAERSNVIPNDPELIMKLTRIPLSDCREGIQQLLKGRWIKETTGVRRASKPASKVARPEVEKSRNTYRGKSTPQTNPSPTRKCPQCNVQLPTGVTVLDHMRNAHDIHLEAV